MTSIRQRRRNRHRVKASRNRAFSPITLILNIDVTKINAMFAQTKDAMIRLAGIQEIAAEALQRFALIPPHIFRGMISVQQTRAVAQEVDVITWAILRVSSMRDRLSFSVLLIPAVIVQPADTMGKEEFLNKALQSIEDWKNGEIDSPEFSLVHDTNNGFIHSEIEVCSELIVGRLIGIGESGRPIYSFNALIVKEVLAN